MNTLLLLISILSLAFASYRLSLVTLKNKEQIFVLFLSFIYWIGLLELIMGTSGYLFRNVEPLFLTLVSIVTTGGVEYYFRKGNQQESKSISFLKFTENKFFVGLLILGSIAAWGLQHLYVFFRIYFTPPNVLDTLTYHLPTLIKWQQSGFFSLYSENAVERIVYATKGLKFLNFWYLSFMGNAELLGITQYIGYILLAIAAYTMLTLLKASKEIRLAGLLAVTTLPLVTIELYTLQDHIYLAALHLTTLVIILMTSKKVFKENVLWIPLIVSTILLLNAKFSTPAHVGMMGLVGLWIWRDTFSRKSVQDNIKIGIVGICLVTILGGWSYINNMYHFNSPFGPKVPQASREGKFVNNIKEFPIRITDTNHKFAPDLVGISGFGPVFFGIALPILLIEWKRIRKSRELSFITMTTIGTTLCYFALYYTPYNYRLLQFIPITGIIVALACVEELRMRRVKQFVLLMIGIISPLLVLTSYFSDYYHDPIRAYAASVLTQQGERSSARFDSGSDQFNHDNSFLVIDQFVPINEPIAYMSQAEPGYDDIVTAAYQDSQFRRNVVWLGDIRDTNLFDSENRPTQNLIDIMKEKKIRYFHNNVVHYFTKSRVLNFEGTPFIQIADELWYLAP